MRKVVAVTMLILWNIQISPAQMSYSGSMKIYITWIKIKAEQEKKNNLNFHLSDSSNLVPIKYIKPDYLSDRFDFSGIDAGNTSSVRIRKNPGAGKNFLADDLVVDLYVGKNGDFSGSQNQFPYFGDKNMEASVINGLAAVAGSILIAALSGGATCGNTTLDVVKTHSHRKEMPSAKTLENKNSFSINGVQFDGDYTGFSFRPLRDTVVDIDGNVYHIAALGGMVIMVEDLRVTHFHNGKEISEMTDSSELSTVIIPAYLNYRRDSGIAPVNNRFYNGYAVLDTSGICPKNWHVPSYSEWSSLINCLGGTRKASDKLMETFSSSGKVRNWWSSSTGKDTGYAQSLYLDPEAMQAKLTVTEQNSGLLLRCIRDY